MDVGVVKWFDPAKEFSLTLSPSRTRLRATGATMRSASMPLGLSTKADLACIDAITSSMRMVKKGSALFRENDPFGSIYAIHAGPFKTTVVLINGFTQVTGFHLVGDTLGLDGVFADHHQCEAIAIEDSCVRIIPFKRLEHLSGEVREIQRLVHRAMSSEIVRESELLLLLGKMSVDQRIAAFLLNLSGRFEARGYSPVEFSLQMSRGEIGSYLGITLETASRAFSKLQSSGIVSVQGKRICILDFDRLNRA
jgi:CRP/FNR family transcriptional regulator